MSAQLKPKAGDNIFVYGTLRPGMRAYYMLEGKTEHIGQTTLPGAAMYSLGGFPGVKEEKNSTVIGDILKVTDESVFSCLDQYEGYPHFYNRKLLDTPEGPAWTYLFQGDVTDSMRVMSGNWIGGK